MRRLSSIRALIRLYLRRAKASDYVFSILVAALIGLGGGFAAIGFRYLIRFVQWVAFGSWHYGLEVVKSVPWYVLIFIPAVGIVAIYPLVNRVAREAKGHGVPEVMEAVAIHGGVIRPRLVLVKALASAVCIGTGGSVGREGPIVQIGSAFGSAVGRIFRVSASRLRTFVGCGAAAGIAGTFNAPVAGAIFAVEVILGDFGVTQFSPIVISSVVSTILCRYYLGDMPAFIVPSYELVSAYELIPYSVLGLTAAFVGVGFSSILYKLEDVLGGLKIPDITKAALGGLAIGGIAIGFPHILGVGYESIDMALAGEMASYLLLGLVLLKLLATSITLASGGSGGIFAPSLFLGAMTGGFMGTIVHSLLPSITAGSGAYAMVGMGAVVSATTHAPLTAMIIIFEMTGDYKIVPPLMAACVIATVVATRLRRTSIYTEKLTRRGVELFDPIEINVLKRMPVSNVMIPDPVVVSEETPFRELMDLVVNSTRSEFFVVGEGQSYVGTISVHQLRQILLDGDWLDQLIIARDMADSTHPSLGPGDDLDLAMKLFTHEYVTELPVISEAKLIGSVRESDVLEVYHRELLRRDLSGGFHGALSWVERTKIVNVGDDYVMAEVEAPPHFGDKSLRELNLRAEYGVEVILIRKSKKKSAGDQVVPFPDYRIEQGDVLLLMGKHDKVKQLMA